MSEEAWLKMAKEVFERYFLFERNDSKTWKKIEQYLLGVTCNRELNSNDVIDRGCVRFYKMISGQQYILEYNPLAEDGIHLQTIHEF